MAFTLAMDRCFAGIEVAKVLGDAEARRAVEGRITEAVTALMGGAP